MITFCWMTHFSTIIYVPDNFFWLSFDTFVGYNEAEKTLYVQFRHGGTYVYSNVPKSTYSGLMSANSKGSFHKAYIKNSFGYRRIG